MDASELEAENALVADLTRMAQTVQTGVQGRESLSVWKARRKEIAALRQRIRVMRARHLGGGAPDPPARPASP